MLMLAI